MSESDEKKDPGAGSENPTPPPDWEGSHTAASLPSWWQPEGEKPPAKPAQPAPPAPPAPAPPAAATPVPPAPEAATPPATPMPPAAPSEWDISPTAERLPTWWRPEVRPRRGGWRATPT